jgi:hypothetical protein
MNVAFSGGGMAGMYQCGVVGYLYQLCKNDITKIPYVYGASAGALSGILFIYMLYHSNEYTIDTFIDYVNNDLKADSMKHNGYLADTMKEYLELKLPENIHEIASGKLFVYINVIDNCKIVKKEISQFKSKKHLIDVIYISMCIPLITTKNIITPYICPYSEKKYTIAFDGLVPAIDYRKLTDPTIYVDTMIHDYSWKKRLKVQDEPYEGIVIEGIRDIHSLLQLNQCKKTMYIIDTEQNKKDVKILLYMLLFPFLFLGFSGFFH